MRVCYSSIICKYRSVGVGDGSVPGSCMHKGNYCAIGVHFNQSQLGTLGIRETPILYVSYISCACTFDLPVPGVALHIYTAVVIDRCMY